MGTILYNSWIWEESQWSSDISFLHNSHFYLNISFKISPFLSLIWCYSYFGTFFSTWSKSLVYQLSLLTYNFTFNSQYNWTIVKFYSLTRILLVFPCEATFLQAALATRPVVLTPQLLREKFGIECIVTKGTGMEGRNKTSSKLTSPCS